MTGFSLFWASYFVFRLLATERAPNFYAVVNWTCIELIPALRPITSAFQKNFSLWHRRCSRNSRHARETKVKSQRAPAANFPLSAACRCASHPPSDPSVLPPEIWNPVSNGWVLPHLGFNNCNLCFCSSIASGGASLDLLSYLETSGHSATNFVTLMVTFSVFLTPFLPDLSYRITGSTVNRKFFLAPSLHSIAHTRHSSIYE